MIKKEANYKPLKAKLRVVNEEFLTDIENSHLSKSRVNSPISVLREGVNELSEIEGAIFSKIHIVYFCKPTTIDLLLDSNLNMSNKVCKEIVSNTVRFTKGIISDTNYQTYIQENTLIE